MFRAQTAFFEEHHISLPDLKDLQRRNEWAMKKFSKFFCNPNESESNSPSAEMVHNK